eukprot:IDg16641t1
MRKRMLEARLQSLKPKIDSDAIKMPRVNPQKANAIADMIDTKLSSGGKFNIPTEIAKERAEFRSMDPIPFHWIARKKQTKRSMEAIAEKRGDLAIILSTGCCKTAVVMGKIFNKSGVTVWIFPLRALLFENIKRLQTAGIEVYWLKRKKGLSSRLREVLLVYPEGIS